ncbi:hypothetical protein [Oceaniglobus trochenteri]|uniref:hypothetical protein n=1 Tax=Oceaniglobus trochenteri TaxID=2763260 RepID=UPI001CFFBA1B|nr:hypothetical protein [Oceaniglobus trochenteri]
MWLMTCHLTPLEVAQALFGHIEDVAEAAQYDRKSGYPWRHAAKGRAAGDFPSAIVMRRLLDYSNEHGLGLTADHLIYGAESAEIEAILASRRSMEMPRVLNRMAAQ